MRENGVLAQASGRAESDLETVLNSTFCYKLLSKSSPLALATKGTQELPTISHQPFPLELCSLATEGTQE